jgi:hypothetical protein
MSDEMRKALEAFLMNLLAGAQKWGEKGADFAAEQIPLVLKEKLYYDFAWATVWLVFGLTLLVIANKVGIKLWKSAETGEDDRLFGSVVIRLMGTVFALPFVFTNLNTMLKIGLAPRVYIIEWLTSLVRGTPTP